MARVYLSLGSNIDRQKNVKSGLDTLANHFGELTLSSLFESEAVGFSGSPFFNMVVGFDTDLELNILSSLLRDIEYAHGRTPDAKKFSPRTLDIDILLYDNVVSEHPVQIPRHEISYNAFVLWPLAEIAPNTCHPVTKKSFADMWQMFDKSTQQLEKVALNWQPPTKEMITR